MPLDMIIGAQWGDEGKGTITDLMSAELDIVARYSGGDNAGHTVTVGDEVFKLHLIPSGIIHDGVTCIIGNGVVLNPAVFLREIDALAERSVQVGPDRLKISRSTHLITAAHIALDTAKEAQLGAGKIGTTQRGIGPAYSDKTDRSGLRAELFDDPEGLADAIHAHVQAKNVVLQAVYGDDPVDSDAVAAEFAHYAQRLQPYLVNSAHFLHTALKDGRSIMAEGAQGSFLDLDHGTYPFVTSSCPTAGGVLTGLGVGPKHVDKIIGIAKAFTSRVGSGPFPCELEGEMALRLRGTGANPWDEYGTTTGRPRRVGWLDLVMLKYAANLNSFTEMVITKLDILSGLDELKVCVGYERNGERIDYYPTDLRVLAECTAVYETLPGWQEDIMGARTMADLPENARNYVQYIVDYTETAVSYISVGPERNQIVKVEK